MVKNILVVDNNPVHLKLVSSILEKRGHRVETATDGLAALHTLDNFSPDIAFVDLIMPYIGGDTLIKILRSRPELGHLIIVIVSGVAAEQETDCSRLGGDVCIAKGPAVNLARHIDQVLQQIEDGSLVKCDGDVIGSEDIFKREITQELLAHKNHSEVILQNISDALLELTTDGQVLNVNNAAVDLVGLPKEQIYGRYFSEFFAEADRQELLGLFSESISLGAQEVSPAAPLSLLGGYLVSLQMLSVRSDGRITIIVIFQDITERYQAQQALKDSHAELDQIFNAAADGMAVIDFDHKVLRANKTLLDLIGTQQGVIGGQCHEILRGACCNTVNCPLIRIAEGDERVEFEEEKILANGRCVTFLITATPYRDSAGTLLGIVEDFKDITTRKQMELDLKESEERFRDLFEVSPNLIHNVRPDGRFVLVNPTWYATLGYRPAELSRLTIDDIIHPDHLASFHEEYQRALAGEVQNNVDTVYVAKDGREVFVNGNLSSKKKHGRTLYIRGTFRNITAQRKAEIQLEEILDEMESIFDASMVGILVVKENRIISRLNKRMAEILGYRPEELIGCSARKIHISEENFREFGEKHYTRLAKDEIVHVEYPMSKKDGSIIWCLFSAKAIAPPNLAKGVIWAIDDISQRKIMEEKLKLLATTDELTGVYNRRMFEDLLSKQTNRAHRHNEPVSLIIFDIDFFKKVNDSFGHTIGDRVLKGLADVVSANLRQMDYFARWGGEEFVILLPKTDLPQALEMADRLRLIIQEHDFESVGQITISIGVALLNEGEDETSLMKRADKALYLAKNNGRNRIEAG